MNTTEIFQILGIEATKDERAIKNAYREKLTVTNPEDNPEGFKRLRAAYEEACRLAKQPEEAEGELAEEADTTPSGMWVSEAAEIYVDIHKRQDVAQWKKLFAEDIFLSLEEEENCRFKLLRFMMNHYRFPTAVWKLFDEKLSLTKDRARLREHFPGDFINFVAVKCERGEELAFQLFEGEPTAEYDLFIQYYEQCYRALNGDELENAIGFLENADQLAIFHPAMEICRAEVLEKQGKTEDAMVLLENLKSRFSDDVVVNFNCAELFWRNQRREDAVKIYEALKVECDTHYMANVRLTEWYYEQKRCREAKKCAEKVLSGGGDDEFMELLRKVNSVLEQEVEEQFEQSKDWEAGLELGWCYLQDGKISKGIKLALELQNVPEERLAEYKGLLAKLYVEGVEYETAINMSREWEIALQEKLTRDETEEEIEKDKDRLRQAHMIRLQCYRCLGYCDKEQFTKAIEEAEALENGTIKDISVLLEKAYIYLEMEEYEKSLEICRKLVEEYQVYAALATSMEVHRRQWNAAGVVRDGSGCINYFPNYVHAYECVAKVYLDLKHTEELKELLEKAEQNQVESVILDAYRYQMEHEKSDTEELNQKIKVFRENFLTPLEQGRLEYYEKGLPILTEYLYWYPGPYMLVERGIFHKAARHLEEAQADFEKALSESPANPYALNGLSQVYKFKGDYEKAIISLKRAILYLGEDLYASVYADLGDLYSLIGNHQMALNAYEQFVECAGDKGRKNNYYMKRMAMCYARCGLVEEGIEVLGVAFADIFERYSEQVYLYQVCGEGKKAADLLLQWDKRRGTLSRALLEKENVSYHCRRGWQELLFGSGQKAVDAFEKVIGSRRSQADVSGDLCDLIFACILCGEDSKGAEYSSKLAYWCSKKEEEGWKDYRDLDKSRLQMNFLANYYKKSRQELAQLLATEDDCQVCHFCTHVLCKEIEGVRILEMLRNGQEDEAFERLEQNLKKQPLDEYMLAIRHSGKGCRKATANTKETVGLLAKVKGIFGKKK